MKYKLIIGVLMVVFITALIAIPLLNKSLCEVHVKKGGVVFDAKLAYEVRR